MVGTPEKNAWIEWTIVRKNRSEILSKDFIKHLEMKDSWWIGELVESQDGLLWQVPKLNMKEIRPSEYIRKQ